MSVKSKSLLFAIILALVTVSTISIIMTDRENSSAAYHYVSDAQGLIDAVNNASDWDVILIGNDITLSNTLHIVNPIVFTTNDKATIRASDSFTDDELIHVDGFNSGTYLSENKRGKLKIGETPTTNPDNILTLDGNNKCRVIYCGMRQSISGTTLTINTGKIINGLSATSGAGVIVTNAAIFEMNGGSIINNHLDPTKPSYHVYQYSEDIWVGSGAEATINNGI